MNPGFVSESAKAPGIEDKSYVAFDRHPQLENKKTFTWTVYNPKEQTHLGLVKWFGRWRQYCFFPEGDLVFSPSCLREITDFIQKQMEARK